MEAETHRLRVGEFDCISLNDGYHDYTVEGFFADAPLNQVKDELKARGQPTDHITSPYACLYVDAGNHKTLVDTGAGNLFPTTGGLPKALQKEGIDNREIDTVIITHAHGDHFGGLLTEDGERFFPNASIYVWKLERDFWFTPDAYIKFPINNAVDTYRMTFEALDEHTVYVEPDCEVVRGITVLDARGHTPGHMVVIVSSMDEYLMYISDTVFHPLHLKHPEWLPAPLYMNNPEDYVKSRQRVLDLAAEKNALVLAMHFDPFPCLGHVTKEGESWRWLPLE